MNKPKRNEAAQVAADAYIEYAQVLEAQAKRYRETAKYYRSGELLVGYDNLPAEAGDHMRHPLQRAIDGLSVWTVKETCDRLEAELKAYSGAARAVREHVS